MYFRVDFCTTSGCNMSLGPDFPIFVLSKFLDKPSERLVQIVSFLSANRPKDPHSGATPHQFDSLSDSP
jgi:hypothetical protein